MSSPLKEGRGGGRGRGRNSRGRGRGRTEPTGCALFTDKPAKNATAGQKRKAPKGQQEKTLQITATKEVNELALVVDGGQHQS